MRALLCRSLGDISALRGGGGASPTHGCRPGAHCREGALGVNFPDILMVEGKYQVKPELPFIPGLEVAGVVIECAPGVTHVGRDERVMAFARRGGGYAGEMVAARRHRHADSRAMDFVTAAAFPGRLRHRAFRARISWPPAERRDTARARCGRRRRAWPPSRSASSWAPASSPRPADPKSSRSRASMAPTR